MAAVLLRRRQIAVARDPAVGWDLTGGSADEPSEVAGRAALAARYLADQFAASASEMMRRHRLTRTRSCFSFWAPGLSAEDVRRTVAGVTLRPSTDDVRKLVAAQLAQARARRNHPAVEMFRAVEEAAWGSAGDPAGTEATLANAIADDFSGHLRLLVDGASIVAPGADTIARPAAEYPPWRGTVVCVDRPGEQCRVIVQVRLSPPLRDAAVILAEALDGADGLLHVRLRRHAAVAYGTVSTSHFDGSVVLGVSLLKDNLERAVIELRRILDDVGAGMLPESALSEAASRVRHRLLSGIEEPFGQLEDRRRELAGQLPVADTVGRLHDWAGLLAAAVQWDALAPVAVGYVGSLDSHAEALLETLR